MRDEDPDRPRPRPLPHEIGQELSAVSLEELAERIRLLEQEIARLRDEEGRKRASRDQARAFFRT